MTESAASSENSSRPLIVRVVLGHPRLFVSALFALVVDLIQPPEWRPITRFLVAWNAGAWTYLVLATTMMLRASQESISRRAIAQDDGRFALLIFSCLAAIASIGAILAELASVKSMNSALMFLHIALSTSTLISSWLFIHMTFALHYAHEYFMLEEIEENENRKLRGGLTFPATPIPDYFDFLYFSYVIGVASQTADVSITSKSMRRVSLAHSIFSFFFNTTILALTINIAAGLV
jgi:uncharacterized membrane protein